MKRGFQWFLVISLRLIVLLVHNGVGSGLFCCVCGAGDGIWSPVHANRCVSAKRRPGLCAQLVLGVAVSTILDPSSVLASCSILSFEHLNQNSEHFRAQWLREEYAV